MNPPGIFNESELKFNVSPRRDHAELAGEDSREESAEQPQPPGEPPSAGEGVLPKDSQELRKARFFDRCLRADRALETPRLPALKATPYSNRGLCEPPGWASRVAAVTGSLAGAADTEPDSSPGTGAVAAPGMEDNSATATWNSAFVAQESLKNETEERPNEEEDEETAAPGNGGLVDSMGDFMSSCKQAKIHPATTGIIRNLGETLKLEYGCMTDRRAQAIIQTLKASSGKVKEALLRSNGLTDLGAKHLLAALPAHVQRIDLSQNSLGHSGAWCAAFKRLTKLRELDASDSQLGDLVCKSLCEALQSCRDLTLVKLGGNDIQAAARDIGALLKVTTALEELDLRWNNITGDPAKDLMKGLWDNWQVGGVMRHLDFSWNPLGKVGGEETCRQLSQLVAENNTLVHLDVSNCYLSSPQCAILAEGLRENRTLLGLHVSGNEAGIDARGFLVPRTSETAVAAATEVPSVVAERSRAFEGEETTCWVCAKWREVQLRYTPCVSGPDAQEAWVFTNVDGFAEATKMTATQGGDFVACIMAPAGQLRFVFQVGQAVVIPRTAPVQPLPQPVKLRRVVTAEDTAAADDEGTGFIADDRKPLEVELACMSCIEVAARGENEPVCCSVVPRRPGQLSEEPARPAWMPSTSLFAPLDGALAPFAESAARRILCEASFASDWAASHAGSLLSEEDLPEAKKQLRTCYTDLQVIFSSLCSVDPVYSEPGTQAQVGMNLYNFTHFLGHYSLFTEEELNLAEVDAAFVMSLASRRRTHGLNRGGGGRTLQRPGFLELLVRLALLLVTARTAARQRQDRKKAPATISFANMLKDIVRRLKHASPAKDFNWRTVQWRRYVLHTEPVEIVCRKHLSTVIDPLFESLSRDDPMRKAAISPSKGMKALLALTSAASSGGPTAASAATAGPQGGRVVRLDAWVYLLDTLQVFPCDPDASDPERPLMDAWDRGWLWRASSLAGMEESQGNGQLELSFVEFMEALARLAALLHARAYVAAATTEARSHWEYGMNLTAPACVFIADEETVMQPAAFAECFDQFLSSSRMRTTLSAVSSYTSQSPGSA